MICTLCAISMSVNADFPINKEYFKNDLKVEKFKPNCGGNAYSLQLFDLEFENLSGIKCIVGLDKQTDSNVMIDISDYDYIKNEGSCQAYVKIEGHWHKSKSFKANRKYNSDNASLITGIWFYFDGVNTAQLLVCIFNDFQASANWIIYEQN